MSYQSDTKESGDFRWLFCFRLNSIAAKIFISKPLERPVCPARVLFPPNVKHDVLDLSVLFVITYHAARHIIERPCHLLSHAVNNSKLTTLPQSKRRWQPLWQRILEARQIIERLAKDPVTGNCNLVSQHDMIYFGACLGAVKYHLSLRALSTKRNSPLLICSIS